MKTIVAVIGFLFLTGCSAVGLNPQNNPQQYSGINFMEMELKNGQPTAVKIYGGKNGEKVNAKLKFKDFEATYSADNIDASTGQAIRSQVARTLAEQLTLLFPEILKQLKILVPSTGNQ